MSDFRLTRDPETAADADTESTSMPKTFDLAAWLPRAGVAFFFILVVGLDKMSTNPRGPWVKTFDQIGLGQWFRYFTGALQISGGLLFLIPRTMTAGAILLAGTMLGAVATQIVILHKPAFALVPGALFVAIVAVWFTASGRSR